MVEALSSEKSIFLQALEITSVIERAAYLDAACKGNAELRAGVDSLLQAHEKRQGLLDAAEFATAAVLPPFIGEGHGPVIGPYKLLQQIGEGGMGTVYMAEQTQPVQRKVALKIIKAGMDSRQVIARFEAERQALALMDHPNIAKVLDAGTTEGGRPYFVMELVKGVPITRYCDEHRLQPRQRLELLLPICRAVQHAHQKGIIHRDLKPSNVLVAEYDDKPVAKVIDFGVAKAIGPKLTDRTMCTEIGQVIGTFEYMSPEQAKLNALDIDTRSDIYALGVLLYELLTGTTPFEKKRLHAAALDEVLRIIREEEPPKPSTRLSRTEELPSIAANRGLEPNKLNGLVRGELDWIVMKCLEKDRNRRYETANGLGHDIDRYLHDEPVQACPPSAWYRFRKFARRNRLTLAIAASAALLVVLVVAGLATGILLLGQANTRIEEQRDLARQQRDLARQQKQLAREAVDDMYSDVAENWLRDQPRLQPIQRKFLEKALRYYQEFAKEDDADPEVHLSTGIAYVRIGSMEAILGNSQKATESFRQAIDLLERLVADFPDRREYRLELARVCTRAPGLLPRDRGAVLKRGLSLAQGLVNESPHVPEYLQVLATAYNDVAANAGSAEEAETYARQYLHWAEKLAAAVPDNPKYQGELSNAHNTLGEVLNHTGRLAEAEREYRKAIGLAEKAMSHLPPNHRLPLAAFTLNLGEILRKTGRAEQAEKPYLQAVGICERLVEEYPDVVMFLENLGTHLSSLADLYQELGRWEDAIQTSRKAVAIRTKSVADFPRDIFSPSLLIHEHCKLGVLLQAAGRQDKANVEWDKVISQLAKAIEQNPNIAVPRYYYALTRAAAGDLTGYRSVCAAMLDRFSRTEDPAVANWVAWTLVLAPDAVKDLDQAVKLAEIAVSGAPKNDTYSLTLGSALYRAGHFGQAIRRLNEISTVREPATTTPASTISAWFFLAVAHHRLGHADEARKWLEKASKRVEEETKNPSNEANRAWNRRLTWQLLRREAEALIKPTGGDHDKAREKEKSQAKTQKGSGCRFTYGFSLCMILNG
jgi:serine/threonine protein kinase/Flp pilus assembly protein TadD